MKTAQRLRTICVLVLALTAMACGPGFAHGPHPHPHPHRLRGIYWDYYLQHRGLQPYYGNSYVVPRGRIAPPPPETPAPYPEENYPDVSPSFSEGMSITVNTVLGGNSGSDDKHTDDKRESRPIDRPKQAAERLATCWRPPMPDRGDTVEVTLRFAFNRSGNVLAPARITYVKAGKGAAADQNSAADQVRKSIFAAIKACTPLHFTSSMAASAPGYPLSVRFIGRRDPQTESGR